MGATVRRRNGRVAVGAAVAATMIFGGLIAAAPLAARALSARGEALGLRVVVGGAHLGWGKIRFSNLRVTAVELPGVEVTLSQLDVVASLGLSPGRVGLHGGRIRVRGTAAELERQVDAWRAAHAPTTSFPSNDAHAAMPVAADGLEVTWSTGTNVTPNGSAWGVRYVRDSAGTERVSADLLRAELDDLRVEVEDGRAQFSRRDRSRTLESVSARSVRAALDVDGEHAVTSPISTSPVVDFKSPSDSRGARIRAELARAAEQIGASLRDPANLSVPNTYFELHHGDQVLNVGPATVTLTRARDNVTLAVTSGAEDAGAPLRFDVTVPLSRGTVDIGLTGGPISLASLGVKEHDMGLTDVGRADVEVSGRATLSDDGSTLHVGGRSLLRDLSIYHPKLARDPVEGLQLEVSGQTDVAMDGSRVHIDDLVFGVGKVKLHARGDILRNEGDASAKLRVEIPLAACSDMLQSIPPALAPLLDGLGVTGTFTFAGNLDFDARRPGETKVDFDTKNECRITSVPERLSTDRFSRPWERTVLGPGDVPTTIESGPGTPNWVPLLEITPYMATAVVVCEDASFWVHTGFNSKSIRDSIRDNLRAGKFLRGASTVSMQLAKNLYLVREKTLSRKLQEAVLTELLEQSLTKEQILELYLNVIEFAPGLYGIGPAALHYFGSLPRDLSIAQSFYLVSILPNPKVHHFTADGTLSPSWAAYLKHLMGIAFKIHRIDEHDLADGLAETVRFGVPATGTATAGAGDKGAPTNLDQNDSDVGSEGARPADAEGP